MHLYGKHDSMSGIGLELTKDGIRMRTISFSATVNANDGITSGVWGML